MRMPHSDVHADMTRTGGETVAGPVDPMLTGFAAHTEFALLFIDAGGLITFVNPAAERMFGYEKGAMLGKTLDLIIPPRLRGAHDAGVRRVAAGQPSKLNGRTVEVTALRETGEEFPIELSLAVWNGPGGMAMGGMIRDISERRQRDQKLHRLAHHDPLTGLANRTLFHERLVEAIGGSGFSAVLLIDLDGFKAVNENLGHATGDSLLQALAIRLATLLDPEALLARFGGDQFVALLPCMADRETVARTAGAIVEALSTPFKVGEHILSLGASIGAAIAPDHATDPDELLADADLAVQAARQAGGNRFLVFEPAMRSATILRRILKDELRDAVAQGELELYYQPQVRLGDGAIFGAEALIRWNHPRRGLLQPASFLHVLENHSLALQVGCWIIDEALRQAASWRRLGHRNFRVAVNLFPVQVDAGNIIDVVRGTLDRHRLPPDALELEATETIVLDRDDCVLAPLVALRDMGVRIAFDDFGTGHASLATLKRIPLTTLKIDRGFVSDLVADGHDAAIVRALLAMGRDMGLEVIAEGVETEAQEAMLRDMGCLIAQGYRYSRPITASAFSRLLSRRAGLEDEPRRRVSRR